ncbi:E3 ubiquitin-protein ligase [Trichinella pseudospiralis]|uniref:E3 ubiquitin-protein ligase n=2 Tax=Trichinella pseudospiralis TaxID=6337 RepID=A0A0V1F682_TRIPS|nr:E3 ubiquitin-protein ligase [Trichinella pseudospiralis]KRY81584.1 E3 ubiquitin-protein ligase [Trichinella pseudospiralis]KRZ13748.1 E3 ubiquitin-protein ligase [Trichinella pseudospiralis]KRZ36661.1 E3 ubiquitin-protein ligase [Trichinella pseudospiralis]
MEDESILVMSNGESSSQQLNSNEDNACCICYEDVPLYPVVLPCQHSYCFLCLKGTALTNGFLCPLCRRQFSADYFLKPKLLHNLHSHNEDDLSHLSGQSEWSWFYEGRNGWWRYDERSNEFIELAYQQNRQSVEIVIAGNCYVIDFVKLQQSQKSRPYRKRKIKRDYACSTSKGIAGLLLPIDAEQTTSNERSD